MDNIIESSIFERLFDMIPFIVYVIDVDKYEVIYGNKLFWEEYPNHTKKKCYEKIYDYTDVCYLCKINELKNKIGLNKKISHECFNDSKEKWYKLDETLIYWPDGKLVKYTIAIDITESKKVQNELAEAHANLIIQSKEVELKNKELQVMYEKMKNLAERDYLTGLYNRRFFYELGENLIEQVSRYRLDCCLTVIDIDHFKMINDNYGHLIGDEVLKFLASKMMERFRKSDIIGRIGGEEFAIILLNTDISQAKYILEDFRRNIESSEVICNHELSPIKLTISIGATKMTTNSLEDNFRKADEALYFSKNLGRNKITIC